MKILEIKEIIKKDLPIHYRNEYTASAVFEDFRKKQIQKRISFILEKNAMGKIYVSARVLDSLDYPLLPVIRSIKEYVIDLEKRGKLL